jgi:hypothetical protein
MVARGANTTCACRECAKEHSATNRYARRRAFFVSMMRPVRSSHRRRFAELASLALVACDPGWSLKGSAHSDTGIPLAGAIAETVCPANELPRPTATADRNGDFHDNGVGAFRDSCRVEVRAAGYVPQSFAVASVCTRRVFGHGCLDIDIRAILPRASDQSVRHGAGESGGLAPP